MVFEGFCMVLPMVLSRFLPRNLQPLSLREADARKPTAHGALHELHLAEDAEQRPQPLLRGAGVQVGHEERPVAGGFRHEARLYGEAAARELKPSCF